MSRKYLKTKDVSKLLDCCISTVCYEIRRGKLPAIRVGNDYRIPVESFEAYQRNHVTPNLTPNLPIKEMQQC